MPVVQTAPEHLCEAESDLLVVDEAHHLVWSQMRRAVNIRPLNNWQSTCRRSAADRDPGTLGMESHFARLRLLEPNRFHDLRSSLKSRKIIVQLRTPLPCCWQVTD
ncbi:hypothetical protein ACNKHR_07785 [Shigella flexneri]